MIVYRVNLFIISHISFHFFNYTHILYFDFLISTSFSDVDEDELSINWYDVTLNHDMKTFTEPINLQTPEKADTHL